MLEEVCGSMNGSVRKMLEIVGGNLRAIRQSNSISQEEASIAMGLSVRQLDKIESGVFPCGFNISDILAFASIYGTSAASVFNEKR